jgi:hypothetical protein
MSCHQGGSVPPPMTGCVRHCSSCTPMWAEIGISRNLLQRVRCRGAASPTGSPRPPAFLLSPTCSGGECAWPNGHWTTDRHRSPNSQRSSVTGPRVLSASRSNVGPGSRRVDSDDATRDRTCPEPASNRMSLCDRRNHDRQQRYVVSEAAPKRFRGGRPIRGGTGRPDSDRTLCRGDDRLGRAFARISEPVS